MVVHDIGEVVGRQVVCGFVEHLVVEDIGVDDHFATDKVVDMYIDVWLYLAMLLVKS